MEKRYDGKSLFKELDHVYEAAKSVQEKFIRFLRRRACRFGENMISGPNPGRK